MARYKSIHKGLKLLPVDFDRQVIPGSFEHAVSLIRVIKTIIKLCRVTLR